MLRKFHLSILKSKFIHFLQILFLYILFYFCSVSIIPADVDIVSYGKKFSYYNRRTDLKTHILMLPKYRMYNTIGIQTLTYTTCCCTQTHFAFCKYTPRFVWYYMYWIIPFSFLKIQRVHYFREKDISLFACYEQYEILFYLKLSWINLYRNISCLCKISL